MNQRLFLTLRILLVFSALFLSRNAWALKIDKYHYQFCIMDDAQITDPDAEAAKKANLFSEIMPASWYSYNGVKMNGESTDIKCQNAILSMDVLMTEVNNGSTKSLVHYWRKSQNNVTRELSTNFYITVDAPSGVSLSGIPSLILKGTKKQIEPTLLGTFTPFSGNGYFYFKYSSSNSNILSISEGKLYAWKPGKVTLKVDAYAKNKKFAGDYYIGSDSVEIEVVSDLSPKTISIDPEEIELSIGQETILNANITPIEAQTLIYWYSSNKNIVSVDDNGRITAHNNGQAIISAITSNDIEAVCKVTVKASPNLTREDVICNWGYTRAQIKDEQQGGYYILKEDETTLIYSKVPKQLFEIIIAYKFDKDDHLCAATLSMPRNNYTEKFTEDFLNQYDSEISFEDDMEIIYDNENLITRHIASTKSDLNMITLGFSYYEPLEERDDCVDLGLSVRWSTTNLGADQPTGTGGFYAFSETHEKDEYWPDNYSFCKYDPSLYWYKYSNPLTNICGTQYDIAATQLGEGWKMPNYIEASELISKCNWEKETVNNTPVYRVTGPNGNSIIIPIISYNSQDKGFSTDKLYLAIGECESKDDYMSSVIKIEGKNGKPEVSTYFKYFGYNIRPVYTK